MSAIASLVEEYPAPGAPAPDDVVLAHLIEWAQNVNVLSDDRDETNWRDFKRLYKKIELRIWPDIRRSRWKQEPDFQPVAEQEAVLLGVLMSRLNSAYMPTRRPYQTTWDYMVRRAERLITRLAANETTPERQALFVPLAFGTLRFAVVHQAPSGYQKMGRLQSTLVFGGSYRQWERVRYCNFGHGQPYYGWHPLSPLLWAQRLDLARRLCEECDKTNVAGAVSAGLGRHFLLAAGLQPPLLSLGDVNALLRTGIPDLVGWARSDFLQAAEKNRVEGLSTPEIWQQLKDVLLSNFRSQTVLFFFLLLVLNFRFQTKSSKSISIITEIQTHGFKSGSQAECKVLQSLATSGFLTNWVAAKSSRKHSRKHLWKLMARS